MGIGVAVAVPFLERKAAKSFQQMMIFAKKALILQLQKGENFAFDLQKDRKYLHLQTPYSYGLW